MSHRRYNPLKDEWVIVSTNRIDRPWKGSTEKTDPSEGFQTVEKLNPLAPDGVRANGETTPHYSGTYVFPNDFPVFTEEPKKEALDGHELFKSQHDIRGTCKVLCFHPDSSLSLATMSEAQLLQVIEMWINQMNELKEKYEWIQIFENKGAAVGCSNSHPHGQLWCMNYLPNETTRKMRTQKEYYQRHGRPMLLDYVNQEREKKERVVLENEHWTVVVPFWAYWPFETLLLPNRQILRLEDITEKERYSLANIMKLLLVKYDNLFECSFPYMFGWHGAPTGKYLQEDCNFWQLHGAYFPPLLRSATVKKFMAGFEMHAEGQRDFSPEKAAEQLRKQPNIHYLQK
uniref:Galactose-1-phosphate uridylyltransferase n=1 Tax=Steinernema glaseri TaxID=37863 RepID=A0A1I7ZK48_9BILA